MKIKKVLFFLLASALIISAVLLSSCKECQHEFGEWKVVSPATCTENGVRSRICSLCSLEEEEEIEASHSPVSLPEVKATCTKTGLTEGSKCSVCDTVITEQRETPIDEQNHTIEIIPGSKPSCRSTGYKDGKKCTECKKVIVEREKLDTLPHTPVVKKSKDATCTSWGSTEGLICSVCDVTIMAGEPIPPIEHTLDASGVCTMCKKPYEFSDDLEYVLSEDGTYYTVKSLGECTSTYIVIPDTYKGLPVKEIGSGAFYMEPITYVKIGKNVEKIGRNAFFSCGGLYYVQIPDSVVEIDDCAFDFCSGIKMVFFGSGLKNISSSAFARSVNINRVVVSENNPYFKVINNVMYTSDGKTLVLSAKKNINFPTLAIPEGVERIEDCAFYYSTYKEITLPKSLKEIGNEAFSRAEAEIIHGGEGLKKIGDDAFMSSAIKSFTFPEGLEEIGRSAFSSTYLSSVTLPSSITVIPYNSFSFNAHLKTVILGNKTAEICDSAFAESALESIIIPDSVTKIGKDVFKKCPNLKSVTIGNNLTEFDMSAFAECNALEEIKVSDENKTFASVEGVLCSKDKTTLKFYPLGNEDISIPKGITVIGSGAFTGYTGTEFTVPDGITTIEYGAFNTCTELERITLGKDVASFDASAFSDCKKLKHVEISKDNATICSIDGVVYSKDKSVLIYFPLAKEDLTIPDSVRVIGAYAFYDSLMESVDIPDTVEKIDNKAFYLCNKLSSVTIGRGVKEIGDGAFSLCILLESVTIPSNVEIMGESAFFFNSYEMVISCEAESKPDGWNDDWNSDGYEVIWGYKG